MKMKYCNYNKNALSLIIFYSTHFNYFFKAIIKRISTRFFDEIPTITANFLMNRFELCNFKDRFGPKSLKTSTLLPILKSY